MAVSISDIFKYKVANRDKLLDYGFIDNGENLQKRVQIMKKQFTINVKIEPDGIVSFEVIDNASNDEYMLIYAENAHGSFIGEVRDSCEKVLLDVAQKCFDTEILKAEQTKRIMAFILEEYGAEPEFLWDKFSEDAAFRRKDNKKWFAVIMSIDKSKLGLDGHGIVEIIDMKANPEFVEILLKRDGFFPAFHMNKKHWFTVCLDGSVADETICELLANSFDSAAKK